MFSVNAPPYEQILSGGASVTMTEDTYKALLDMAKEPIESAAVLLARVIGSTDRTPRLIVTAVRPVPEDAYLQRSDRSLEIASDGYMHALSEAEATTSLALWVHTHPGAGAVVRPSRHDDKVNTELHHVFAMRSQPAYYAWMILGYDNDELTFSGAVAITDDETVPILRVTVVGAGLRRIGSRDDREASNLYSEPLPLDLFDRNIRALGSEVQKVISDLVFGVVGAGGTGSAVAEQLVRLGARHLLLIDPDTLSLSNVTRVYGSTPLDVDRPKVEVLASHLQRIAPDLRVEAIHDAVTREAVARRLLDTDLVFGCTDDNAGRLRLSRLPFYYYIPVIDCGVQLTSDQDDIIDGIFGRVTTVHPGAACLVCRERVDLARAEAELRSADEQARLEREHYAVALPGVEPALVPFTTMTAAWAISELVERLIGYGERPSPSELVLRVHERKVNANMASPTPGHYCHPDTQLDYDEEMFLGMNWPS
jgi:proteasome lid subunit RPN8/RPN11